MCLATVKQFARLNSKIFNTFLLGLETKHSCKAQTGSTGGLRALGNLHIKNGVQQKDKHGMYSLIYDF